MVFVTTESHSLKAYFRLRVIREDRNRNVEKDSRPKLSEGKISINSTYNANLLQICQEGYKEDVEQSPGRWCSKRGVMVIPEVKGKKKTYYFIWKTC